MKFGICGYGNLGKAMESVLLQNEENLVAIFSRREGVKSNFGTPVFCYKDLKNFSGKIDVMLMCGGSQQDLVWQTADALQHFNVVDSFDTHACIAQHKQKLTSVAKVSNKVAIYSCGWDPGLFSILRTIANNVFLNKAETFWGKGVSQGHSEALRNIDGVQDAIQFTVPNKQILQKAKAEPNFHPAEQEKHERHCYVCLKNAQDAEKVQNQIANTPHYFKGQKLVVKFCTLKQIEALKQKMYHKGVVLAGNQNAQLQCNLKMKSNPLLTAQIIYAYAQAIPKLNAGAYSVLDIPVGLLGKQDNSNLL